MTAHVDLRSYIDSRGVPTLVLIDVQKEYLATSRRLALADADDALVYCRAALDHARAIGLPIAFVRWVGRTPFFSKASPLTDWIDGFEPRHTDMVFERSKPSCYASPAFATMVEETGGRFVVAGFSGEAACLSTAVDAFHRGHNMTFLADASSSHALYDISSADAHRCVSQVISLYANVLETADWTSMPARKNKWGGAREGDITRTI